MKKNVASQKIGAGMVSATDGSAFTGAVTVYVTGDAGTQAAGSVGAGACTHEGNGYHTYAPAQAETNYDLVAFTFIGTGAVPATVQVFTAFPQTVDNATALADVQARIPAALTAGGNIKADALALSGDTTAADNAEAFFDGTGYAGTGNVIPTVTTLTNLPAITAGWLTATGIAADAITAAKIADGAIDAATFAAGAINAAAIAADAITDAKVAADVTIASVTGAVGSVTGAVGSVTGSVGSVTGAVGSVTGNVGGNVTGSVGSVVGAVGSVTGNVGGNVTGTIGGLTAAALKDFFDTDSATTYASAVAGSVVKEIADNAGGSALSEAGIAAAVWASATRTVSAATNITNTGGTIPISGGYVQVDVNRIVGSTILSTEAANFRLFFRNNDVGTTILLSNLEAAVADIINIYTGWELDGAVYRLTTNALEQAPSAGAASSVSPDIITESRTWYADGYRARNIVSVESGFIGTFAMRPRLNTATTISSVSAVTITGAATVTATDLTVDRSRTKAHFTVPALTTEGTYTVTVTVTTNDGQTIITTGTLKVY